MSSPTYTRLENDERRRRLLDLGARLFTEHAYDEISMSQIARAAGISKALLYHYFPSKRDYFVATLAGGAEELRARVEPDPDLPPAQALAGAVPEVRALVDGVRAATADRILEGLDAIDNPRARTAVRGWLWFMDGACLDWIARRDLERSELHGLLLGTLAGALVAAGVQFEIG